MKRLVLLLWMTCLGVLSCKRTEEPEQVLFCKDTPWYKSIARSSNEDELIMELSNQFIINTSLQAYEDHNAILSFAIDNALDLEKTESGLFYKIINEGDSTKLDWGEKIRAHYRGYHIDGKLFDSSCKRKQAIEFYIGNMIPGWNEGLQLIGVGGKILLAVPSRLGYGSEGLKDNKGTTIIKPDKVLIFEIEVMEKVA